MWSRKTLNSPKFYKQDYVRLMKSIHKIKADMERNISLHNEIAADPDKTKSA